jgi:DNA-binding NtrC family response regulator
MPPLRERIEDIELLINYYFNQFSYERNRKVRGFSPLALQMMRKYDWPGNIRELINKIRRGLVMCENAYIGPEDLGIERRSKRRDLMTLNEARAKAEHHTIQTCLQIVDYNISEAARELGVSRTTLYRLMHKYEVHYEGNSPADAAAAESKQEHAQNRNL